MHVPTPLLSIAHFSRAAQSTPGAWTTATMNQGYANTSCSAPRLQSIMRLATPIICMVDTRLHVSIAVHSGHEVRLRYVPVCAVYLFHFWYLLFFLKRCVYKTLQSIGNHPKLNTARWIKNRVALRTFIA